jgi:hypothetical protein
MQDVMDPGHAVIARVWAEIKGVNLTKALSKEALQIIQDAWISHRSGPLSPD